MKVKQRDVYLSEYKTWSFKQRLYHILKNKMATNVDNLLPRRGFMQWCLMDLLNLVKLVIIIPLLWLTVGVPLALYLAHDLKTKYVGYSVEDGNFGAWTENNRVVSCLRSVWAPQQIGKNY